MVINGFHFFSFLLSFLLPCSAGVLLSNVRAHKNSAEVWGAGNFTHLWEEKSLTQQKFMALISFPCCC